MSTTSKRTRTRTVSFPEATQTLSLGVANLLLQRTESAQRDLRPAGFHSMVTSVDVDEAASPQEAALRVLQAKHGGQQVRRWIKEPTSRKYSVLARYHQQFPTESPFARLDELLDGEPTFVGRRKGRRVLLLNAVERAAVAEACPHFTVEPVRPVYPASTFGRSPYVPIVRLQASGEPFQVFVKGVDGAPVVGADISASPDGKRAYQARTDHNGIAAFTVAKSHTSFTLVVKPSADYWPRRLEAVTRQPQVHVTVNAIVPTGAGQWERGLIHPPAAVRGQGVRVGVVDSGASHPALTVQGGHSFLENGVTSIADGFGHGTHCAGIIAARSNAGWDGGLAPGVELYVYRVFDDDGDGGDTDIVAEAIDRAVDDGCHLINLSLATDTYNMALHNAVKRAADAGVLCVAASGNAFPQQPEVMYPARHPEVASAGAIGLVGTYPAGYPGEPAGTPDRRSGTIYTAGFSCRGQSLKFVAPGVAVVSTVPQGYAAEDGTSMAAPMITGVAALLLEQQPALLQMPPDRSRCEAMLMALTVTARDLGLPRNEQGSGCPVFP